MDSNSEFISPSGKGATSSQAYIRIFVCGPWSNPDSRDRTTLGNESAGRLPLVGQHFQPGRTRKLPEFGHGAIFPSQQHHLYHQTTSRIIRRHAAENHNATVGARRLGAVAQDRRRFRVGPVVQDSFQQINVSASRQWVEEALSDRRDSVGHAGGPERLAGERDGTREINQGSVDLRAYSKNLREHRPCAAADVDYTPHTVPATADLELRVGRAMSWRPDEVVETRRDIGIGVQVFPKRQAEDFMVSRLPSTDIIEECSPCVSHATADAVEVKADALLWVE